MTISHLKSPPAAAWDPGTALSLTRLWQQAGFSPNDAQQQAILHVAGPLFLPAGPGSGKTRVLLWRTLNLIVFHGIKPEEIFLSTFTEKAALQLKEGLRSLLSIATKSSGVPYDLSKMYVGTVHSLCQRILTDRRFFPHRQRGRAPAVLDELDQYFHLNNNRRWGALTSAAGLTDSPESQITQLLSDRASLSKYAAVTSCLNLFNRFSEECLDPISVKSRTSDATLQALLEMYRGYLQSLAESEKIPQSDLSLLQQKALQIVAEGPAGGQVFKHIIIDEYQDTNPVQEALFFQLAAGYKNLCVVGDDDQALYRFRGATVENFVQFPLRCQTLLNSDPSCIPLTTNYRSRENIVAFYSKFMRLCDWHADGKNAKSYRVQKNIEAHRKDRSAAVLASTPDSPENVCRQIAQLVRRLLDERKVENANQIAFLFPSLKSAQVQRMKDALEKEKLRVYAPRAGRFLEVEEAVALVGLYQHIFGKPARGDFGGRDYHDFHRWLEGAYDRAKELLGDDKQLKQYIKDRRAEIAAAIADYNTLLNVAAKHRWDPAAPFDFEKMRRPLYGAPQLSERAKRSLASNYFAQIIKKRIAEGNPFSLAYILKRATSLDWNVLDLFYRLCGFDYFKKMFDAAESGEDEGPICNLALISQYLARYTDQNGSVITAEALQNEFFSRRFFSSYLYVLFRRGESEYEDANDPFPKGRVPFLTIHQAKGLEFPVVVLGNPRKKDDKPQIIETLVQPLLDRESEPLDSMAKFDVMRMFYVALSRAQNLLVIAHFKGKGQSLNEPFKKLLDTDFPRIPDLDLDTLPEANAKPDELPKNYSYTGDFLLYQKCSRQYMIFRKYGFVPSRSQTMMFGSLVHQTLDDLHQYLISLRSQKHESQQ
ncbi:MAG: ATP-dependent DNA helicase Rep [bacterium]|nr:ATP-dependent DNA helicase Rep [bacterium]